MCNVFDDRLRTAKDTLLRPFVRSALGARLSPSAVTVAGLLVGLGAAGAAAGAYWTAATVLWLVNRLLDGLDGALARATGRRTDSGGYIDIVSDFVVYAAVPIGIALGVTNTLAWASVAVYLGACYVNAVSWMYLSAVLEKRGAAGGGATSVVMPRGIVEGFETILAYVAALLFPVYSPLVFFGLAALVLLTAIRRVAWWLRRERQ